MSRRGGRSNVDESLFGEPSRKTTRSALPNNVAVISMAEIRAIKERSVVRTGQDEMRERAEREAAREEKQKIARQRKERMLKLEADSKMKAKKSDVEIEKMTRENTIRELAEKQVDQNLDMVKMLNSLGARAAAFTIRDQQLAEMEHRGDAEKAYNARMDMVMEIDRLKDLSQRERLEKERRVRRVQDREVIVSQIKGREKQKMLEEEARERENQEMLARIKKYEEEDRKAAERRQVEVERSRKEIMEENARSIKRKENDKLKEIEEMERLRMYQLQKDAEMAAREKYEEDIANEKKEQQAKLLAQQESSQNKQAEVDELRARRYAEARERKARNDEREGAARRRQQMMELTEARRAQADNKKAIMAREAVMQQQEYEDSIMFSLKTQKREAEEARMKQAAADEHRTKLQQQIDNRHFARSNGRSTKYEEGEALKQEFKAERAKLGAIRDKMVDDLRKKGVNPKYLSEMQMCDIQKLQMR